MSELTGVELVNQVHGVLIKYVIFPVAEAPDAVTLWIAATHVQPAWECAARLQIRSPLKRCGKSRLLDLVENLTADPLLMVLATPAALFRSIGDEEPPTLLLDEADTIFGSKEKSESQEAIRGILNAGHQRGRMIPRCVPPTHEVRQFPTFAMAALAGIGSLPDTIEDRSVIIELHRRAPGETVAKLRWRRVKPGLHELRDQLHAWARGCLDGLREADPELPVDDRAADTWEPLIAIADAAGGDWPARARKACKVLAGKAAASESDLKMSVRLLADLRDVFARNEPADRAHTEALLGELRKIGESPWHDYYGHPLDARDMASLLREYGVKSKDVWIDGVTKKGYRTADLWDSWQRYLPDPDASAAQQDELSADPGEGGLWPGSPYPNARSARSARQAADQGKPHSLNSPYPLGPLGQGLGPLGPQGADQAPSPPSGPSPTPWPDETTPVPEPPDDLDDEDLSGFGPGTIGAEMNPARRIRCPDCGWKDKTAVPPGGHVTCKKCGTTFTAP